MTIFGPFLAACTFLTRLPLPVDPFDEATLARSSIWFPVVGAMVGGIGGLMLALAAQTWPPFVAAVLSLLATVLLTGAMHEDALADAADGFGGGRTREHVLEIMRDSRIGSYGTVALVLALSARIGCLAAMAPVEGVRALVAAHVLARWSSLPLMLALPYARSQGSASPFVGAVTKSSLVRGTLLAGLVVAPALAWRALPAAFAAVVVTVLAGRYFRRRLGGITGDCLGAANQVVELTTYLTLLA